MLPKTRRLSSDKTIEKVKLSGKVYANDIASFVVDENENGLDTKFCVIVSTKVSNKAIKRNYLKRKVFLVIEKNIKRFKDGSNIVIIVKKGMLNTKTEGVESKIMELAEKGKVIK